MSARRSSPAWLVLGTVGLGVSTAALDSAVNVAFPTITRAFGIPVADIQWVIIGYGLTYPNFVDLEMIIVIYQ